MKTTILILALIAVSCQKSNPEPKLQEAPTAQLDCDCDRVVERTILSPSWGGYLGTYTTINDCTQIQITENWSTNSGDDIPVIGECY